MSMTNPQMSEMPGISGISEEQVYEAIADVLDPELDEPIVKLGFIDQVIISGSEVIIIFKLPTYWCAPNFAYLMASDLRSRVSALPAVRSVKVVLLDHFADEEINKGINQEKPFAEAFQEESEEDSDLENLRQTFLRKGFLKRQDELIRQLLRAGIDELMLLDLRLADITIDDQKNCVYVKTERPSTILEGAGKSARLYMQKRSSIGLPQNNDARLITDEQGQPVKEGGLKEFLRRSRSIRLSITFNTSMCKGLFRTRYENASANEAYSE
jgi:metal-sulfur cluster biosynthetic enzyme